MKYKLFRSPGNLDKAVRKHELVAVETGKNIDDVADALIRAVRDDLAEMPEYAHCETAAYAPEPIQEHRRVRRYQYEMMGVVYPQYAEKNILIDYGVIEESPRQPVRASGLPCPDYRGSETAYISYHCPSFLSIGLSILPEICSLGTQSSLVRQCSDTKLQFHR